jgi:DNA-binding FadR family transcriptional regulator
MDFWRRGVQDVAVSPQSTNTPLADSGIAPVTRRNANTRAYLLLKQAVLSGSFRPAQVITLRMMTEFLGLGEMPAREALKRLISEGAFTARSIGPRRFRAASKKLPVVVTTSC